MKKTLFLLTGIVFCLFVTSCAKKTELSVSPASLTFDNKGGSQTVSLFANKAWTARSGQSWCKVSNPSGNGSDSNMSISVTCEPNDTYDSRSCSITFTCEELTATVNVTQSENSGVIVSPLQVDVSFEGGEYEITVQHNVAYTVAVSDDAKGWITITGTKGLTTEKVGIKVSPNTGTSSREGNLTFKTAIGETLVKVVQESDPDNVPSDQIWYATANNTQAPVNPSDFDRSIISHTYKNGKGVIVFDGPLTRVGGNGFDPVFGEGITEIHLPNTVERIGNQAFIFSRFTSFRAPDNLKSVGFGIFAFNNELKRLYGKCATADEKFLVLDGELIAYAAASLPKDGTLVVPDGVKSLPQQLFRAQTKIKDVILPEGLVTIGDRCFTYNENLETVTFPASLKTLGDYVFEMCSALREFKGDCMYVKDGRMYIDPDNRLIAFAGYGAAECVVPDGVISISGDAFRNNKTLRSLTIPRSCETFYTNWLLGCDQLEAFYGPLASEDHRCLLLYGNFLVGVVPDLPVDYTLPAEVTNIFWRVFEGNKTTERLTLQDNVASLYDAAFIGMESLRTIRLSAKLSNLRSNAFQGDKKLDTIMFRTYTPPAYEEDESLDLEGLTILVPEGMESLYKKSYAWSKYADHVKGFHYNDLPAPDYYMSKDYSKDGEVTVLQKATEGNGIDIVLMGDGYSDRQVADGTYATVMKKMADAFFSEEPYKTYRKMFNVYAINVVSATEGYENAGQALGTFFGGVTMVGGSNTQCMEYALKAVPQEKMDNTLIIVAMNEAWRFGGTCYFFDPASGNNDYGCGFAIAYFTAGGNDETLASSLHHEAGGHGFAKLADEYTNTESAIPNPEIDIHHQKEKWGWWKNVDFTGDPSKVKWAKFLTDDRYKYDGLGVFEGACTYTRGAWRPTVNSIMRDNTGGFNAPSREAIWYRLHKLAYGDSWTYNYEDFVKYDAVNRKTKPTSSVSYSAQSRQSAVLYTHPPVAVGKTWKEAYLEAR